MSTDRDNEWASVFGGGDKKVPSTPSVSPKKSASAGSEFESVFGTAEPPAPVNPAPRTGQADASTPRQEAGLLSDEAAALLKAKVAETGQRIVGGLGIGAKAATEKAKALRTQTVAGAGHVAARLQAVHVPKRALTIAGGSLAVLAAAALAVIYWPVHRTASTAPAASSASASVATPAVAASVASVHAATPAPIAVVPAPAPAIAASVTPAPAPASATCTFDGRVVTADGTLVSGATVTLNAKGSFRAPVTTGPGGHFAFTNPSGGGVYALQVQAPGYRTLRVGVAACATGRQVVMEPVAVAAAPVKAAPAIVAKPKPKAAKRAQPAPKVDYGDQEAKMKAWDEARKAAVQQKGS